MVSFYRHDLIESPEGEIQPEDTIVEKIENMAVSEDSLVDKKIEVNDIKENEEDADSDISLLSDDNKNTLKEKSSKPKRKISERLNPLGFKSKNLPTTSTPEANVAS